MRIDRLDDGFALVAGDFVLLRHRFDDPAFFVGHGRPLVDMYRGNFALEDRLDARIPLRDARLGDDGGVLLAAEKGQPPLLRLILDAERGLAVVSLDPGLNRFWLRLPAGPGEPRLPVGVLVATADPSWQPAHRPGPEISEPIPPESQPRAPGHTRAPHDPALARAVEGYLIERVAASLRLDPARVRPETGFQELGLDSILAQYQQLDRLQADRMGQDPSFLLSAMDSTDPELRRVAANRLAKNLHRSLAFDPSAPPEVRHAVTDTLRRQLVPPATTQAVEKPEE